MKMNHERMPAYSKILSRAVDNGLLYITKAV